LIDYLIDCLIDYLIEYLIDYLMIIRSSNNSNNADII